MEKLTKIPNHSHAWRGTWNRPMKMDEDFMHPFTVARMTNHKVRGNDSPEKESTAPEKPSPSVSNNDELEAWSKYRHPVADNSEEYYFYKFNQELIEEARRERH